jgi:hypothetical protein
LAERWAWGDETVTLDDLHASAYVADPYAAAAAAFVRGIPPQSAYTTQQNPNYGFYNVRGQFLFGQTPDISGQYVSPATLPQYPIEKGGYASEITRLRGNNTFFNSINAQVRQVNAGIGGIATPPIRSWTQPVFKSQQDKIRYIQAQYSQPLPGIRPVFTEPVATLYQPPNPGAGNSGTGSIYTTNSLFPKTAPYY